MFNKFLFEYRLKVTCQSGNLSTPTISDSMGGTSTPSHINWAPWAI